MVGGHNDGKFIVLEDDTAPVREIFKIWTRQEPVSGLGMLKTVYRERYTLRQLQFTDGRVLFFYGQPDLDDYEINQRLIDCYRPHA